MLLVLRRSRIFGRVGLVVFRVNILAGPVGPSAKTTKFMPVETRSVRKQTTMGKSTIVPTVQNPGPEGLSQAQITGAVTPETLKWTRQENDFGLGEPLRDTRILPRTTKGILVEGITKNYDEDGGDASDPPTWSFLRWQLDEQTQQFEQWFSLEVNILTEIRDALVNKGHDNASTDQTRQLMLRSNPLPATQAEIGFARLKMVYLEKVGGSTSRTDDFNSRTETSVDMVEV